jgi:hypothetical protein
MANREIPKHVFLRFIQNAGWMEIHYGKDGLVRYITPAGVMVDTYHYEAEVEVPDNRYTGGTRKSAEGIVEIRKTQI